MNHVSFFSEAPLENIEAHSYKSKSLFDAETGEIVFTVPIRTFEFKKSLMQEHFNEKFMESAVMPVTLVVYSNTSINTLEWSNPGDNKTTDRFTYSHQLLIARKFNKNTSLQLMPTLVHRNRIPTAQEDNLIYALGIGGRQKLTQSVAITFEYYYQFNNLSPNNYENALAIGFDIETGGHVFQLHFTNARPTFERGFITETTGDFLGGDIHFGFNITRAFQLTK